jgi:DNA-binding FadR family transcriptional regulator
MARRPTQAVAMTTDAARTEGRLYERIAAEIRQALASGRYGVGDRLPSERDLAQQYGVSRPTIRESIIALEVDGLVEVRTNSGVYVTALVPQGGTPSETDVGPFELLEARRLFEAEICALASQHIDADGIARLRQLVVDMESADLMRAEAADREFHLEIARATENSAMEKTVSMLWDTRDQSPQYRLLTEKVRAAGVAPRVSEHHRIVDALESGDSDAAREAMRDHLGRVVDHLLEATEVEAIERARAEVNAKRQRFADSQAKTRSAR